MWLTIILPLIFFNGIAYGQAAKRFDVIITEIFPDPSPTVGLPPNEFIEVRNVSQAPVDLKDWKFGDYNSMSTIAIAFLLQPDSVVIICANSSASNLAAFGKTIGVSNFPSLDNDGDVIFLRSKEGALIHALSYRKSWYRNDLKSEGGWTLEMIDTKNPCGGSTNWSACTERSGGTPGKRNSIDASNKDVVAPVLLRTYAIDSITIVAVFDEPLDSLSASAVTKYVLDPDNTKPLRATPGSPLFTEVILKFSQGVNSRAVYHLTLSDIADCAGNICSRQIVKAGLPSNPGESDMIVNEILFNPKSGGFDYIELYNNSKKIIDLQHLYTANKNTAGAISNSIQLSDISYLVFPGEFVVFTENSNWLKHSYLVKEEKNVFELPSLPSLPDDKGIVVILNMQGIIIEELQYDSKWHFPLIENKEGIALERIDYNMSSQNRDNWTSAASTAGFGTPGYQNSQFQTDIHMIGSIAITPNVFSPDNDGFDDILTISYQMPGSGYVANVTIFDSQGRPIRYLAKNTILGLQGSIRWDGLDDNQNQLPVGIYVVFTEIFNLRGKTKKFKNVTTLARRF